MYKDFNIRKIKKRCTSYISFSVHLYISVNTKLSVTSIVRKLKQETTINLWKNYPKFLSKHFWKEHTFWSDGYFACSIGEANPETIKRYIENQD